MIHDVLPVKYDFHHLLFQTILLLWLLVMVALMIKLLILIQSSQYL